MIDAYLQNAFSADLNATAVSINIEAMHKGEPLKVAYSIAFQSKSFFHKFILIVNVCPRGKKLFALMFFSGVILQSYPEVVCG